MQWLRVDNYYTGDVNNPEISISFNHGNKGHEIYIGLYSSNGSFQFCQDFSLQEARDIADTLYNLVNHYNQYSNQKDKQND
jgi:hypothetical protein